MKTKLRSPVVGLFLLLLPLYTVSFPIALPADVNVAQDKSSDASSLAVQKVEGKLFGLESATSQLLYSTVLVLATFANGGQSIGTAFSYVGKIDADHNFPMLVTLEAHGLKT